MKDLKTKLDCKNVLTPLKRTADATGTGVDRQGADSLTFLIHVGIGGITFDASNKIEFVMEHSDDDSTYSAVVLADTIGPTSVSSGIVQSFVAEHAAAAVYPVGYRGSKRYARVKADFTGTHGTGTDIGVSGVRSHLSLAPAVSGAQ